MKALLLLSFCTLPLLFSSCGLLMADHSPKRPVYVSREVVRPSDDRPAQRAGRSEVAVVTPLAEGPQIAVR